jgi:peptidoglycan-N-acetylglucosamine deacetylase
VAYLTIDDVPSPRFREKLAYLKERRIPALLFCVGQQAKGREDELALALASGCLLGNHSFTHPSFSEISLEDCRREIEGTDALLETIYERASIPWKRKFFRFPFFDCGGDGEKAAALQLLLRDLGYRPPSAQPGERYDTLCSFDQEEYRIENSEDVYALIDPSHPGAEDVILIHDHEKSHEVFFGCVDRYRKNGIRFEAVD